MKTNCILFAIIFLLINFSVTDKGHSRQLEVVEAFPAELTRPVGAQFSHEGSPYLYVYTRDGLIKRFNKDNTDSPPEVWFDLPENVFLLSEGGLLGLAFHPDFPENPSFFVNFTYEDNGQYKTRISRFQAPNEEADHNSQQIILEFDQPASNHNGGSLEFGADGYLYISSGDGGGSGSRDNSQDTMNLLGAILRIDINTDEGYLIPPDNPFVNNTDGLDEIYAWGLRNPWRMSFDRETGHLWVADVGSSRKEIIHVVENGKNYGYPIIEGSQIRCSSCDRTGLELPVFEYDWGLEETGRSITGGYVYRGTANPSLYGKYIYGDFISGRIWALEVNHETLEVISNTELIKTDLLIPSFGIDSDNEIYIVGWSSKSKIFRFTPELFLTTLSLKTLDNSKSVELNWQVNNESGIDSFELFRGSSMEDMELYETIGNNTRQFLDPDPLDGATFYAVRAIEANGDAGKLSNPVSFYRAQDTLINSWRLISIPFETDGLFLEDATIYSFDRSYILENELVPGRGYWTRSTAEGGTQFTGEGAGIQSTTMQLKQGWNLIGAAVSPFPAESIIDEGDILNSTPVYGFNGSTLKEAESILPGQGYWIYADEEGEITIDLELEPMTLPLVTASAGKENDSASFDTFEFSSASSSVKLHAAKGAVDPEVKNRFRVPPLSPNPMLDVRSADGFKLVESSRFEPEITASEYPLSVRFNPGESTGNFAASDHGDVVYEVTAWRDGVSETSVLNPGTTITLSEPADRIEFLMVEGQDEMVRKTELLPSYPNPFNPVTNLSYRIAEQQNVELSIYDATGRRVAVVLNEEQAPGQYTVPFNASGLASGIYFVRFSAGDVLSTQKLTLIK